MNLFLGFLLGMAVIAAMVYGTYGLYLLVRWPLSTLIWKLAFWLAARRMTVLQSQHGNHQT